MADAHKLGFVLREIIPTINDVHHLGNRILHNLCVPFCLKTVFKLHAIKNLCKKSIYVGTTETYYIVRRLFISQVCITDSLRLFVYLYFSV